MTDAQREIRLVIFNRLKTCRKEPLSLLSLRDMLLALTQLYLMDPGNGPEFGEQLSCLKYEPGEPANNITLNVDGDAASEATPLVPSITLTLSDVNFSAVSIGDQMNSERDETGASERTGYAFSGWRVTWEVRHLRYDVAAALTHGLLAWFVGAVKHALMHPEISGVQPAGMESPKINKDEAASVHFKSAMALDFTGTYTVRTAFESHVIKRIVAELGVSLD